MGGGIVHLLQRFDGSTRLWIATLELPQPVLTYLAIHGRPIRYGYVARDWPLDVYQNVYAREPGSAEMPSAGRPFTPELVHASGREGRRRYSDRSAHRRVIARSQRAPVSRVVSRSPRNRRSHQRNPARRRSRDCDRNDRGARAGVGRRRSARRAPRRGMDRRRGDSRTRRDRGRRLAHRLARTRGVTPANARSGRGTARCSTCRTPPRRPRATCGTSSATCTCSCPNRVCFGRAPTGARSL